MNLEIVCRLIFRNCWNQSTERGIPPLESFKNNVGGRIISTKSENDFGYVVINAKNLNNKGQIIVTNSNSIILNGLNVDLSRGTLNIKSGRDFEAGLNEVGEPSHYGLLGNYQDKRNFGQVETAHKVDSLSLKFWEKSWKNEWSKIDPESFPEGSWG